MNRKIVITPHPLPANLAKVVETYFKEESALILPVEEALEKLDGSTLLFLVDLESRDPRIIQAFEDRKPLSIFVFAVGLTDWLTGIEHTYLDPLDPSVPTKLTNILVAIKNASPALVEC